MDKVRFQYAFVFVHGSSLFLNITQMLSSVEFAKLVNLENLLLQTSHQPGPFQSVRVWFLSGV
jgi:hypothetical protein